MKISGKTPKGTLAFYFEDGVPVKVMATCEDGKKEVSQNLTGVLGDLARSAALTWAANLQVSKQGGGR